MERGDVRISQPDPSNEDIAFHIIDMYRLKNALHSENAQQFLNFIISPPAQQIYQKYGFVSHFN